jgi:hypothetical protein
MIMIFLYQEACPTQVLGNWLGHKVKVNHLVVFIDAATRPSGSA